NEGIEMDRKEHVQVGMRGRQFGDRVANLLELFAPALPAVHGHEEMPAAFNAAPYAFARATPLLRVDGRVARDDDLVGANAFAEQRRARTFRRSEVKARQTADHQRRHW